MRLLPLPSLLRRPLLVPLVVIALVTGACSSVVDEAAVTVEGTELSADALEEELEAITGNADYRAGIEQQFGMTATGEGEGTWNTGFVARLLSLQTYYELLEQELGRRDIEVTAEEIDEIRETTVAGVGGPEVFDAFPASYQETLLRRRAVLGAVEAVFRNEGMSAEGARAYYDEHIDEFETRCMAHILVGTNEGAQPTGDRTSEEAAERAAELYDQLQAGADFTALASSDANDDTTSAAKGGDLGCITPTTSFDPTFLDAAFAAEVGKVTEPVETQFGYHLILVSSTETPPFEEIEQQVEQSMAANNAGLFNEFLVEATCEGDIDVAPRYGSWDTSQCSDRPGGGIGMVTPPEGPAEPAGTLGVPDGGAPAEDGGATGGGAAGG